MIYRLIGEVCDRTFRSICILACAVLSSLFVFPPPVTAAENLYTVVVPLDAADPKAQENAYKDALDRVLIRVTGSADEQDREALAEIFTNAARYVLRFRPRPDDSLEVSFDGEAIEQMLHQSRYAIWGSDRPLTMIWLAVDWGQGEREIVGSDLGEQAPGGARSIDRNRLLRERIVETAKHRGIPVAFPLLDTEDLEKVGYGDIWGGFDDRLIDASRRYGASSILIGRVRTDNSQRDRWTYYFGVERLVWSGQAEEVINRVADALAAQFAISGDAVLETYSLTVEGIDSLTAYGRVQQLLDNLSIVESFKLNTVSGEKIEYSVSVYGGIERLKKALAISGVLQEVAGFDVIEIRRNGEYSPVLLGDPIGLEFEYLQ